MAWKAPKLRERVQIRIPVQTPNSTTGGFDRGYEKLATVWSEVKPSGYKYSVPKYVRNVTIDDSITHFFTMRWEALLGINLSFGAGFTKSFNSVEDLIKLKANYFLFMEHAMNSDELDWEGPFSKAFNTCYDVYYGLSEAKGRLFRIVGAGPQDERKEFVTISATELEEFGSGFSL